LQSSASQVVGLSPAPRRGPLPPSRPWSETLNGASATENAREFLQRIHQQVDRLTTLVNELLDLSRIESGAIELQPEPIDLAQLVGQAVSLMRTRTESHGITVECPSQPGASVEGDRTSLLRVVSNLLDNAIKFSPRGGTIHVSVEDEGDLVALRVRDEGEGIPEADIPRVFERSLQG
jgi:signal transduction histidine kinase